MGNKCCADAAHAGVVRPTSQVLAEVRGADGATRSPPKSAAEPSAGCAPRRAPSLISTDVPSPASTAAALGSLYSDDAAAAAKPSSAAPPAAAPHPFPVVDRTRTPLDIDAAPPLLERARTQSPALTSASRARARSPAREVTAWVPSPKSPPRSDAAQESLPRRPSSRVSIAREPSPPPRLASARGTSPASRLVSAREPSPPSRLASAREPSPPRSRSPSRSTSPKSRPLRAVSLACEAGLERGTSALAREMSPRAKSGRLSESRSSAAEHQIDRKIRSTVSPRKRQELKPKFRSAESPHKTYLLSDDEWEEFPDPPFRDELISVEDDAQWVDLVDGTKYRGGWNSTNTIQDGRGELMCPDGSRYIGEFKRGVAHGLGIFRTADGCVYRGQFANGRALGYGVYAFADGTKYLGEFVDDKPHGRGKEVSVDGVVYVGDFVANTKQGEGVLTSPTGDEYRGHFVNGEIRGFGEYKWADGRRYVGHWERNLQCGKGIFEWPDGKRYEGDYYDGQMHGRGTLEWPDGRKYIGQWANGQLDGEGIYWSDPDKWRMGLFRRGRIVRFHDDQWNEGPVDEQLKRRKVLKGITTFSGAKPF